MPRPKKCRWVSYRPGAYFFKPRGIPMAELTEIHLTMDEMEAMRQTKIIAAKTSMMVRSVSRLLRGG
jgi:predicted DNA-binding protein (UPF0251 family)